MPDKVRIALDAMGGDHGASVILPGADISLTRHPDIEYLLFGDSAVIWPQLEAHPALKAASRVVHTDVMISMKEKPSQALRHGRKNSSMWRMLKTSGGIAFHFGDEFVGLDLQLWAIRG